MKVNVKYLHENPKLVILLQFILQPLLGHRQVAHIIRVDISEVRRGAQVNVSDALDKWELFPLSDLHDFQQPAVHVADIENVVENIFHEPVYLVVKDYRRVRCSERFHEQLRKDDCQHSCRKKSPWLITVSTRSRS